MNRAIRYRPHAAAGFSTVELMVALAIDLFILAGLAAVFLNSERSRNELERANRQIENGRYAMQVLTDDIEQAGYYERFDISSVSLATPSSLPDPCATSLSTLAANLVLPVQGYYHPGSTSIPSCISDVKANTSVLVIRRVSGCVNGATDCTTVSGAPYFQASQCDSASELGSPTATNHFKIDTTTSNLTLHKKDCSTVADVHQFYTRIYYIANNDQSGDGIPTLKRVELGAGGGFNTTTPTPIAEGIEYLDFDYGLDTNGDGAPDSLTNDPGSVANWQNVVTVRISLLARNATATQGYTDTKTYSLGLQPSGTSFTADTVGPLNTPYKRHVYQGEVRLNNVAERRV